MSLNMSLINKLFGSHLTATQAEVERSETLLNRDGLIPIEDEPGHRGALELWRRHCQRADSSQASMLTAVRKLLELPSCGLQGALDGLTETTPRLAWIRPADIWFATGADFPYHCTVEDLAQLASNLITEQAHPHGMAMIHGFDYWLRTVPAPHGLLHQVSQNGNYRTVAIKAAGFPVAFGHTVRHDGPWELSCSSFPLVMSDTVRAYLRLLLRAGLLTKPQRGRHGISFGANSCASLLLVAGTVEDTLRSVATYEQFYGRCEAWPDWLRDRDLLTELLNRELLTMESYDDLTVFSQVVGQWPPPVAAKWKLLLQRLAPGRARLDP
jgi:hypothetical protein